jgi:hypothetical protein
MCNEPFGVDARSVDARGREPTFGVGKRLSDRR